MIIFPDRDKTDTDNLAEIKDRLETDETVQTLLRQPGQVADSYRSAVAAASHPPLNNYIIGHGVMGLAWWFSGADLAKNLVARGLQAGDQIYLITCFAAEPLTKGVDDSAAMELAQAFTTLGVPKVTIFACPGYVNWNAGGELLIHDYVTDDPGVKKAAKAWTNAEDKAWNAYVTDLKKGITGAVAGVAPSFLPTLHKLLEELVGKHVENVPQVAVHLQKADPRGDADAARKAYINVVNQAVAAKRATRDAQHTEWSEALRTLLTDTHTLATDLLTAKAAAAVHVSNARATMYASLRGAWPAYSRDYYDRLRVLAGPAGKAMTWQAFTS
jgi:hypothetical protein